MRNAVKQCLGKIIRILYACLYRWVPVHDKTVLFVSFHGKGYSDNPKALFEYMRTQEQFKSFRFVWAIKHHKEKALHIEGARVIEYFSIPYFFYLARSKYWFINCKLPAYMLKKKSQYYLQTWHGTPLKKLAHDIELSSDATFYRSQMNAQDMYKSYDDDVLKYNAMVSPNPFSSDVFQSAFRIDKERLLESGYPRCDALVNTNAQEALAHKQAMGLPLDKKIILYAPTWRDNSYTTKGYTFTLQVQFQRWRERLGSEYVVVFKPHYLIVNNFDVSAFEGFVYEVDATVDITHLYTISDLLITDYSSVFFDYALLKRPIYFYMFDLKSYAEQLRGFYFDIYETLPGDIVENEDDLLDKIVKKDYDYTRLNAFNRRFNAWHDGHCSEKIIDYIFKC